METSTAKALIAPGVPDSGGSWADLGAGSGTFTQALADLLGPQGTVYAVDRERRVMDLEFATDGSSGSARVVPLVGDFTEPLALELLDGVVMANSLHFVEPREQVGALARIASYLRGGGALLVVEYDQSRGSPWVPHPVPPPRLSEIVRTAGLAPPTEIGRRPSRYGPRDIYAAVTYKPG